MMETKFLKKRLPMAFILGLVILEFFLGQILWAGRHPRSRFEWDEINHTGYFDLVVTIDWEDPAKAVLAGGKTIAQAFHCFAKKVYDMTEGRHKIRTVYVYVKTDEGEQEKSHCDIYIKNAAAKNDYSFQNGFNPSILHHSNARINMFTRFKRGSDEEIKTVEQFGGILAHEFGHYVYGLYDEHARSEDEKRFDILPNEPWKGDTYCTCIMNGYMCDVINEFCTDKGHLEAHADPGEEPTNVQQRMLGKSCWRTLISSPFDDPTFAQCLYRIWKFRNRYDHLEYPGGGIPIPQENGDNELDIKYVEVARAQVVLLIDRSGSMVSDDKMSLAKLAAGYFVDLLQIGDRVSVVSFGSDVSVNCPLREILQMPPQMDINETISNISAGGSTAMGDGMRYALNILKVDADPDLRRAVVLLGDGRHNYGSEHPDDVLEDYRNEGIPIFTIGLGPDADDVMMRKIASNTGGDYYSTLNAGGLHDIYAAVTQKITPSEQMVYSSSEGLSEGEVVDIPFLVDSSITNFTCLASWNLQDIIKLELVTPGDQVISPANVESIPDVAYASESTYALYRVQSPSRGAWKMRTTGESIENTGAVHLQIHAVTDISLSLATTDSLNKYPAPIGITALLAKDLYIANAVVKASITTPEGNRIILNLRDDGKCPDFIAHDGLYSGIYMKYTQDGEYEIVVTAANPNQTAAETEAGFLKIGESEAWNSIGENFLRSDRTVVTVSGVTADDHGNSPGQATFVQSDRRPTWGRIEQRGDLDFFKFSGGANKTYSIRTAQLIGPIDTIITLYDQNGTPIKSDDNSGGGKASHIIWTNQANGTYYVGVKGGGKMGAYRLIVGPRQPWEIIDKPPSISIRNPVDGSTVYGTVTIQADAEDDNGINRVEFYIDDTIENTATDAPYAYDWNTLPYSNGLHRIKATVYDTINQKSSDNITVSIQNVLITLDAARKEERAWIIRKYFGKIELTIENPGNVPVQKYVLYRKETGKSYYPVVEITASEINGGSYTYLDKFLDEDTSYTYRILAYISNGDGVGISNEQTI